jgi:hypothetical protein
VTSAHLCVVLWRANERGAWEVQPYAYSMSVAETVAWRLLEQFRGEAWIWIGAPEPPQIQILKCEGEA